VGNSTHSLLVIRRSLALRYSSLQEPELHHREPRYTEAETLAIQREFSRRRHRQWALAIIAVPWIAAGLIYGGTPGERFMGESPLLSSPPRWFPPVFLILAVGALAFSLLNWRCPGCSKYLGRGINPRRCPRCGVALR